MDFRPDLGDVTRAHGTARVGPREGRDERPRFNIVGLLSGVAIYLLIAAIAWVIVSTLFLWAIDWLTQGW